MSLKLVHLTLATAVLAASANGLSVPQSQGAAFSRLEAKFPATTSGRTKEARAVKQAGSVKVKPNEFGLSFYVPTVISNQTFQLIYDTGSADLWVLSKDLPPWQADGHLAYAPTSPSKLLPNQTWAIKYAGGQEVSGVVYTDTVKAGPVVAHNQAVQAAVDNPFSFESDGILGLAFGAINTVKPDKQRSFFETAMLTLKRKLFATN